MSKETESEVVFVVQDDPDGGLTARALGHAIFTQADDLAQLREMVRDAVRCHFDEDEPRVSFAMAPKHQAESEET